MVLDPHYRPTEIQDLDLNLSLQGIDVLPPRLRRNLDNGGRFIGIDGRLQGHFEMNYPEDRRLWNGHGEIRLRGDRQGDIYLVNSAFHRTGAPLVRNTRWRWERIDRIDWGRGYAIGDFHLQTLLNPTSLLRPLEGSEQGLRAYGGDGQVLLPGEVWAEMPYDNQPWSPRGFRNRIVDYIETLCRQDPRCGL
ncbi:MAG: hypothetical protein K8R69_10115 [Deltaproteobacteria bacterium]|nr:hypothetical protein [Deltaproteobacteria bacterium]